jgi:hypothetical protein
MDSHHKIYSQRKEKKKTYHHIYLQFKVKILYDIDKKKGNYHDIELKIKATIAKFHSYFSISSKFYDSHTKKYTRTDLTVSFRWAIFSASCNTGSIWMRQKCDSPERFHPFMVRDAKRIKTVRGKFQCKACTALLTRL